MCLRINGRMKSFTKIFLLSLLLVVPNAFSSDVYTSYQHYFDSISVNKIIRPAFNNEGELTEILLVDETGHLLTIISPDGDTLDNLQSDYIIDDIEAYYSPGADSLFIYILMPLFSHTPYAFGTREPFVIKKYMFTDSTMLDTVITPYCNVTWFYDYETVLTSFSGSIELEKDIDTDEWLLVLHAKLWYSQWLATMGTWDGYEYTYKRYSSDLNQSVNSSHVKDRVYGYFDNTDAPGYGYHYDWYENHVDDPENGYTHRGKAYGIKINNTTDIHFCDSDVPYQFAGDFIKDVGLDEFICFGTAVDLTGLYESQAHSACYTFSDNGVPELAWYHNSISAFVPSIYLENVNKIFGLQSGSTLLSVNCANGQIVDSIPISEHNYDHTRFFDPENNMILKLFGVYEDTLFVFSFDQTVDIADEDDDYQIPSKFNLRQNYPNPFNASTTIIYSLSSRSDVTLSIYNLLGQKIYTRYFDNQGAGEYTVTWDGLDQNGNEVGSGMYFYLMKSGEFTDSKKMLLLK